MLCRLRRQLRVPTLARRAAARCRRQLVLRHLGPLGVWLHDRVAALVQLAQVRVLDGLPRGDPLVGVIGKQLRDQVDTDGGGVGHERLQRRGVLVREVEIDVGIGVLLQLLEGRSPRRAQDLVDLGDLVELVCAGKERREREHLKKDAADPPHVHLVGVEAVCEEALGRAVPSRRDVLSVGLLRVYAAARAKVGQLELFVGYQDILRLDVAVKDAVPVHVLDRADQLVHVPLHSRLGKVLPPPADELVYVHVHQLKH
mmetsp:Transcript_5980/g.17996  ORF Transcript_5980/g.17996 Transcript_5980/m.17996 type:complete len:257 (-) Transcript_5980:263-1033(-)